MKKPAINGRSRPTVEVWEECPACHGSGCHEGIVYSSQYEARPCRVCDGEGKVLVTEPFGGKDER